MNSSIYLCLSSNVLFVFVISKSPVTLLNRLMFFFSGVGISVVLITGCIVIYYNVVVAYCIFYFFASMTGTLPWTYCDQDWNTCYCRDSSMDINSTTPWENSTKLYMECSEYLTKPIHPFIQDKKKKTPNTTAADNKFCDILLNFRKKGIIFHENCLPADNSHEISCLICYF